jgi:hypothetical protein
MPNNLIERVHSVGFLTDLALRFPTPQLLADRLAPRVPVRKQTDKYRKFGKDAFYQPGDNTWAPGAIPNAIRTELSEDQYFALPRKLRHPLLQAELNNADDDLDLRALYTERTTLAMRIAREARVAALFTTTTNYAGSHVITKAGGAEWDAVGIVNTVQPITDIESMISTVTADAFVTRDMLTVVIPEPTFNKAIRHNAAIRDYYKYTIGGVNTPELLAAALGVKEVLLARTATAGAGPQNAGNDIIAGITTTYLWGETVWVGVTPSDATGGEYSFARTFNWTAETDGEELRIAEYEMADLGQEGMWIEGKEAVDEKIVANFAGGIIVNTTV